MNISTEDLNLIGMILGALVGLAVAILGKVNADAIGALTIVLGAILGVIVVIVARIIARFISKRKETVNPAAHR